VNVSKTKNTTNCPEFQELQANRFPTVPKTHLGDVFESLPNTHKDMSFVTQEV